MVLQTVLFPEKNIKEKELYFRKEKNVISFDTYFNSFSIMKWRKYTKLKQIILEIEVQGSMELQLFNGNKCVNQLQINTDRITKYQIPYPVDLTNEFLYFKLIYKNSKAEILKAAYITNIKKEKHVNIVLNICTFKREKYIIKNLKILNDILIENPHSPIYGHLKVFVIDNGRTLDRKSLETKNIRIIPNINSGGSGGFARGMRECIRDKDKYQITHVINMDDDIIIEPDSIIRTYAMLVLMKDRYANACIAGSMLRLDVPYILHESGAYWDGKNACTHLSGIDLRKQDSLQKIDRIYRNEYAGWWFACYSMEIVNEKNLPLPLFLHLDDIEYGLRNKMEIILLNGICVWHEPFENKRGSHLNYYDVRNMLIVNSIYRKNISINRIMFHLFKRVVSNILRYRYKDVFLIYMGVLDFLKGPEWLKKQNPERLNKKILDLGYKMESVENLLEDKKLIYEIKNYKIDQNIDTLYNQKKNRVQKAKYIFLLNGWILPPMEHKIYPHPLGTSPYNLYRQKEVLLFDPDTQKGILGRREYKKAIQCLVIYIKISSVLLKKYNQVSKDYQSKICNLMTVDFIDNYLDMKKWEEK